jgi:hypothetical protein
MKRFGIFLSVLALFLFPARVGAELVWDVANDFSASSNPTGVWSYGWKATPGGTLNLYDTVGRFSENMGSELWMDSSHADDAYRHTPDVYKNFGPTTAYGVLPGEVAIHPSWLNEPSVIRWTSPITGQISVTGSFGAGDSGAMSYFIYVGNTQIFYKPLDPGSEPFSFTQAVTAGTTIDFMVGEAYWYGSTPLHATIQELPTVPIPGAIFLFAPGLAAIMLLRKKALSGE